MAAPIAIGMVFQTLYYLVDLFFVGRLGDAAIAGVSTAGNLTFLVIALTQGARRRHGGARRAGDRAGAMRADANLVFNPEHFDRCDVQIGFAGARLPGLRPVLHARTRCADDATAGGRISYLCGGTSAGTGHAVPGGVDGLRTARHRHRQAAIPSWQIPHGRAST